MKTVYPPTNTVYKNLGGGGGVRLGGGEQGGCEWRSETFVKIQKKKFGGGGGGGGSGQGGSGWGGVESGGGGGGFGGVRVDGNRELKLL